jgi:23S rRNA pseudouridine1911/1915/1917 synthase
MSRLLDNDLVLAVDKPPGVSMATSTRPEKSAAMTVARLLEACGEPSDPHLRLVHRLDVGTSGVVLLARGDEAHRALSRAFQSAAAQKTYRALAWGHPVPARGSCDLPLERDPKDGRKMRAARGANGKQAVTRYETLARLPSVADLRLFPETGRTHQIRVHLSCLGHPIVGDDLYGGAKRWRGVRDPGRRRALQAISRPLLHAERVAIPDLGIDVSAPLPADHVRVLDALGADG